MDGILVVNKPQRMTSHDVVAVVRRHFAIKKAGHAGTLDPMATGVLVLLLGKYTKLSGSIITDEKEYAAALTLGARSDTGDAWGSLTPSGKPLDLSREEIERAFRRFTGEIEQVPPMYSAVKVGGRKLYELARKGIRADVKPRRVVIKELEITGMRSPEISFRMVCSKGTYVRQLCVDVGEELGCGAYMSRLERTRSGPYTIAMALGMDEVKSLSGAELAGRLVKL
jgi:tRNA pseudouridine55 synthase